MLDNVLKASTEGFRQAAWLSHSCEFVAATVEVGEVDTAAEQAF